MDVHDPYGIEAPMFCTIAGDSLAVGIATYAPHCAAHTRAGIGTEEFLRTYPASIGGDRVIISLGANDGTAAATIENLLRLRRQVTAREVIWLLPGRPNHVRQAIGRVARFFGDLMIGTRPAAGGDGLHLPGQAYRAIASLTVSGRATRP